MSAFALVLALAAPGSCAAPAPSPEPPAVSSAPAAAAAPAVSSPAASVESSTGAASWIPLEALAVDSADLGAFDPGPRDPFSAPGEEGAVVSEAAPAAPAGGTPLQDQIELQGIIYSPDRASAIINNQVRTVGQEVLGAKVVKITESAVYFKAGALSFKKELGQ